MTGVVSYVKNNKKSPLTLNIANMKMCSFRPGEEKRFELDVWTASGKQGRALLEKLNTSGVISVRTQLITDTKIIETADGKITVTDISETAPVKRIPAVSQKDTLRMRMKEHNKASIIESNTGHKIVDVDKKMAFIGAKPVTERSFDNTRGFHNNIKTGGFEAIDHDVHASNIFSRQSNTEKVPSSSLFKHNKETLPSQTLLEELPVAIVDTVEEKEPTPDEYIGSLLAAGDWNTLLEYLKKIYPGVKFTKTKLKQMTSVPELKETFGI